MLPNEFLATYPAKLLEYGLGMGYLFAFVLFWRYLHGRPRAALATAHESLADSAAPAPTGWFTVPEQVYLHPGHTWARVERDGTVTVGLDDFAHRLLGPMAALSLPRRGDRVGQGEPAIQLALGDRAARLLSPVDGTVVAVNPRAVETLRVPGSSYEGGWLFRVSPGRLAANVRQLLSGCAARRWLDDAGESLALHLSPELGAGGVMQDGGVPVHGIAQGLDREKWEDVSRTYFLT